MHPLNKRQQFFFYIYHCFKRRRSGEYFCQPSVLLYISLNVCHKWTNKRDRLVCPCKNKYTFYSNFICNHGNIRRSWKHLTLIKVFILSLQLVFFAPPREKSCFRRFANNKGADQPAHPHSLISALVIRFFESIISKLATSEISIF